MKQEISTTAAPAAIGIYSQAVRCGKTVYLSGQIPLDPISMQLVSDDIQMQIDQVFDNLLAVVQAAGGQSMNDIVKLTVYLLDLNHFALVNQTMERRFEKPYPARAVLGVSALPRQAHIEIDAVMVIDEDKI